LWRSTWMGIKEEYILLEAENEDGDGKYFRWWDK
jgi:hypothetical protein